MQRASFPPPGIGAATLLLGACAQRPDTIAPAPVSEAQYYGWTCPRLRGELGRLDGTLADLYAEQLQSRNDDVLGYVFRWRRSPPCRAAT